MIVAGGVYLEKCRFPRWDRIFGSGLRSAIALSGLTSDVTLHAYVADELTSDVTATLAAFAVRHHLRHSTAPVSFTYLHAFEKTGWTPDPPPYEETFTVEGDAVLRFGLIEGDAIVKAKRAVYDPQAPKPRSFSANESEAHELVIICGPSEALALAGVDKKLNASGNEERPGEDAIRDACARLRDTDASLAGVLIKDAFGGLTVYVGDEGEPIPSYAAESYFRIGAGDIIAAGFYYAWAKERRNIRDAADFAARCVAFAMEGPRLPLNLADILKVTRRSRPEMHTLRILGGDTLELQALALHTKAWIEFLGGKAVIGDAVSGDHTAILLVGDPPRTDTFERLASAAQQTASVVYWPEATEIQAKHWFGDAVHARDFATALYRAMRTFR